MTPQDRLFHLLSGFQATQAIHTAFRLGVFDTRKPTPFTSQEIARSADAHEPSVLRLLRFLCSVEVLVEQKPGSFLYAPIAELLAFEGPDSSRAWAALLGSEIIWRPWGQLYESVVTGTPSFEAIFSKPFFSYLDDNRDAAAVFNAAMASDDRSAAVVENYDFSDFRTVVDVGGGHGAFLQAILAKNVSVHGILYDLPTVIRGADDLRRSPVGHRCQSIAGDMFQSVPAGGDAYVLKRIIHDWDDARALAILRNCRAAMSSDARLLVVERIIEPGGAGGSSDLMMLVLVSGRERTEHEFRGLLQEAGFQLTRVVPCGGLAVLDATPL